MNVFFLSVVNMSIAASWCVLAVLLIRLLVKKAPKWIAVLLWALVAVRLLVPFAVESKMSLIPSAQTVSPTIMTDHSPQVFTGFAGVNNTINPIIDASFSPTPKASVNPLQVWIPVSVAIWWIGMLTLAVYSAASYFRMRKKLNTAILLRENIFQSERVGSPFVLGMLKPKIYLPFHMSEPDMSHVIAHEQSHICRRDHWIKPLGFVILTLHWFNPLIWLAYSLLCKDIELACDERVVKKLAPAERADYSQALLHCSVSRRSIASCPVAFGEVSVKNRVRSVLKYRKPAFWILIICLILIAVLGLCFLTNPMNRGSLAQIEFLSLSDRPENTACVWVSDGETFRSAGDVGEFLLQDLIGLEISEEEISLSRSDRRDKSNTLVLQTAADAEPGTASYLSGLYLHFNADFTAVWANNGVKPTLSYQVLEPQKARTVFESITNRIAPILPNLDLESLKIKFPMYFDLGTFKGLEIYVWQMAEKSYSCGVLPGLNRNYTQEEIWQLHKNSASLDEMRAIIESYIDSGELTRQDVTLIPVIMPHSNYAYTIDDAYRQNLNALFWMQESALPYSEQLPTTAKKAAFDIDGDGFEEDCFLYPGPTSGVFTFCIAAYENDELEYFNIFMTSPMTLNFAHDGENQTVLIAAGNEKTCRLQFSIREGTVILSDGGDEIPHWGIQGIDSPYAPKIKTPKLLETITGGLRTYYRMSDGTWRYGGYSYKYKLEISGHMPNAAVDTTFVYLSNLEEISFSRAMWASGISSNLNDYFSPEEAVMVDWRSKEHDPAG